MGKHNDSKVSKSELESMETEPVDKDADLEYLVPIDPVLDQNLKSLIAIENDMSEQKWEILETSPMKKTFRKTLKPLETRKKAKTIKFGNPGGSQVNHTPTSDPGQSNVDLTQSKQRSKVNHTSFSNLGLSNVDLMQSKNVQESQVNHTPKSNLEHECGFNAIHSRISSQPYSHFQP